MDITDENNKKYRYNFLNETALASLIEPVEDQEEQELRNLLSKPEDFKTSFSMFSMKIAKSTKEHKVSLLALAYSILKDNQDFDKSQVEEIMIRFCESMLFFSNGILDKRFLIDKVVNKKAIRIICRSGFEERDSKHTKYTKRLIELFSIISLRKKTKEEFWTAHEAELTAQVGAFEVRKFKDYFSRRKWRGNWIILDLNKFVLEVQRVHSAYLKKKVLDLDDAKDIFMGLLHVLFNKMMEDDSFLIEEYVQWILF